MREQIDSNRQDNDAKEKALNQYGDISKIMPFGQLLSIN